MATFLNEPGPDSGPSIVDCEVDDKRSCLLMVPAGRVVAMNGISRRRRHEQLEVIVRRQAHEIRKIITSEGDPQHARCQPFDGVDLHGTEFGFMTDALGAWSGRLFVEEGQQFHGVLPRLACVVVAGVPKANRKAMISANATVMAPAR